MGISELFKISHPSLPVIPFLKSCKPSLPLSESWLPFYAFPLLLAHFFPFRLMKTNTLMATFMLPFLSRLIRLPLCKS